jgi:hypothetical protein
MPTPPQRHHSGMLYDLTPAILQHPLKKCRTRSRIRTPLTAQLSLLSPEGEKRAKRPRAESILVLAQQSQTA